MAGFGVVASSFAFRFLLTFSFGTDRSIWRLNEVLSRLGKMGRVSVRVVSAGLPRGRRDGECGTEHSEGFASPRVRILAVTWRCIEHAVHPICVALIRRYSAQPLAKKQGGVACVAQLRSWPRRYSGRPWRPQRSRPSKLPVPLPI